MKLRPMIFKPETVRAFLNGTKESDIRFSNRFNIEVGDRVWVRETWSFEKDSIRKIYKADITDDAYNNEVKWKSPLIMPKAASRIMLSVKNVTKKKWKDISYLEMFNSGIVDWFDGYENIYGGTFSDIYLAFVDMFKQIYKNFKVDENLEVFVFDFWQPVFNVC